MNSRRTIVPKGTEIIGSLELRNDSPLPRHLEVRIGFPRGFSMKDPTDSRFCTTPSGALAFSEQIELINQYDSKIMGITVKSPDEPQGELELEDVCLEISEAGQVIFRQSTKIHVMDTRLLSRHIMADAIYFPTDEKGAAE